ncbi:MAG: Asp23/Gls24 family envelope stress response protein [Oscillospiraceae bacterium]|nr:Asp23/Gls24 family envelope stress response protein [Oscillospiraceae bacterium]MBQ7013735.1 Asp23/Gls24 family envelope stress response protein [Oscillospiraceae bacterium]
MLFLENHIGKITVSDSYLCELTRETVQQCFGVAGLAEPTVMDRILNGQYKTVGVVTKDDKLEISVHIRVMYGVNIPAVVRSLMHKVEFVIEDAVRIPVSRVRVYVDEIVEM